MALITSLAIVLLCVLLATRLPWLGLELVRDAYDPAVLRVAASAGPSQAVPTGVGLVAVAAGSQRIALQGTDRTPEPELVFLRFDAFAAFLDRQDRIADLLATSGLRLELDGGRSVEVRAVSRRPITDLPFEFWLQLAAGFLSILTGGGLLAFRPSDPAVRYCVLAGVGVALAAFTAAIYSTRELALPSTLFVPLQSINHFGACLAGTAFLATLWLYPRPLTRRSPGSLLLLTGVLWWLAERLEWLPFGAASSAVLMLLCFVAGIALSLLQWRRIGGDLRARAALKWFLLSWLFGGGVFAFVVFVPALAGRDVGELVPYAFGSLLLTQAGLALGVARYRLFDLEVWSFRILLLVGGAFAVLALDLLLLGLLHLDQPVAMGLSLIIAGWLYFPARQWLSQHLFAGTRQLQLADVPALLRDVLTASEVPPDRLLPETLQRLFAPLHLASIEGTREPRLVDDGLALQVPGIGVAPAWELRLAQQGQRLFNRRDLSMAAAVQAVIQRFAEHQQAIRRSVDAERQRVAQDLHDDVGARVLTLLHRSPGGTQDEDLRGVLESLREAVYALGPDTRTLDEVLASLRAESAERCEAAGAVLAWREHGALPASRLRPGGQQDLVRVLREAISNALRHARPRRVDVDLQVADSELRASVANDGAVSAPASWRPGVGLRSMRGRVQRLGGDLVLEHDPPRVRLRFSIPLDGGQT